MNTLSSQDLSLTLNRLAVARTTIEDTIHLLKQSTQSPVEEGPKSEEPDDGPPQWMRNPDGTLATFYPDPITNPKPGQINCLCPPGIGDFAWIYSKLWSLCEKYDVTFWFQDDNVKRIAQYADLIGVKYAFTPIDIHELLKFKGEMSEEDLYCGLASGLSFYCHANRHIEEGKRVEEWFPYLPYKNPAPTQFGRWREKAATNYVTVHIGHQTYGGGNWPARIWARMCSQIQSEYGLPVMPVGAYWDKDFIEQASESVDFQRLPCIDRPLSDALLAIMHSRAFIAVDSGLAILAKYLGVPVLQAYPAWLCNPQPTKRHPIGTHMPESWETDAHPLSRWCLLDEVLDKESPRSWKPFMEEIVASLG